MVFWLRVRWCGEALGCAKHICLSAPVLHMETWCCVPCHRHRKWHGLAPAAKSSDGRPCACCVLDCWPVRRCGMRRLMVGIQVMAVRHGSSLTLHFPVFFQMYKTRRQQFGNLGLLPSIKICFP